MKVLHITTSDNGGAGLCCLRIHRSLLKQGIESKVLTRYKTSNEYNVYKYKEHFYSKILNFLERAFSKILRLLRIKLTLRNNIIFLSNKYQACFTSPLSWNNILDNKLVDWADIIHLHWVNDFLDYPSFFTNISKPIVWTLHDENFFYGLAHYSDFRDSNYTLELKYTKLKHQAISKVKKLGVVFLCNQFYSKFSDNKLIRDRTVKIIHNSVDTSQFKPLNIKIARRKLKLSDEFILFGFISFSLTDRRKGLKELCQAIELIKNPKIKVVAIGNYSEYDELSEVVIPVGFKNSPEEISEILSACNYFAMPSFQETFAQSPLEAMACGLPVIAFPTGICCELVCKNNGVLCSDFSVDSLVVGINILLERSYDSSYIRQNVIDLFSPDKIAQQYIDLYKYIID